jgi:malate synthase
VTSYAPDIAVSGPPVPRGDEVLTPEALDFVASLEREFGNARRELLHRRLERRREIDGGGRLDFLAATAATRAADWTVTPAPADLLDRRVEITGPAEPKMLINALNSGARVFMADLEDALSPTWPNVVGGQVALRDAVRRELAFTSPEGKAYRLNDEIATLLIRPRG